MLCPTANVRPGWRSANASNARLSDGKRQPRMAVRKRLQCAHGIFPIRGIRKADAKRPAQQAVLPGDPVRIIKAAHLYVRHPEPLHQILRGIARFRVQDKIEVGLAHFHIFIERPHPADLPNLCKSHGPEEFIKLTVIVVRGELPQQVDRMRVFPALFKQ